jgi:hypothetical protein
LLDSEIEQHMAERRIFAFAAQIEEQRTRERKRLATGGARRSDSNAHVGESRPPRSEVSIHGFRVLSRTIRLVVKCS